ncbi:MAG: ATP-binding protein [bacterium]
MADALNDNARDLERELEWFAGVLDVRLRTYFEGAGARQRALELSPPALDGSDTAYAEFVRRHALHPAERLVVLLALIPHLRPQLLDVLWTRNQDTQRGFTEFGGLQSATHGGFVPTGETAVFLLAGDDLAARFAAVRVFEPDHVLAREAVVQLAPVHAGESPLSGALTIAGEVLHRFTTGIGQRPCFNSDFPARRIETRLTWEHLVLSQTTLDQLDEIRNWALHGETLLREWDMADKLRPGFTSLFHGPPGTGKTLSACLLGKHCDSEVYKIDLGMIVSKYIGETEKNLARVFDLAEHKRWILFFDEADALFGKRTRVDDARDRYANQEVSFLLQRIEDFDGVVILASNFKTNIDDAFVRRFQSVVYFPVPRPAERLRIWREAFSPRAELERRIDLGRLADAHELTGGTIMNVVRYASLMALSRGGQTILLGDVEEGIRRELVKEGRVG